MNSQTKSLYTITSDYLRLLYELNECDEQTFNDTIEGIGIEDDFKTKAINVAAYFLSIEAEAKAIRDAENKMAERRKVIESNVNRLKSYLLDNMEITGISKIECPEFSISLAKCPDSVEIINESILPDEFFRIKKEPDKVAIKGFLKVNGELDGAVLITNKMRLNIK